VGFCFAGCIVSFSIMRKSIAKREGEPMEETKKLDEASKAEELAERVELTDDQLDQASGGWFVIANEPADRAAFSMMQP